MGKIGFTDILALAKNGYTPADIKELLAIETNEGINGDSPADDINLPSEPPAEDPAGAEGAENEPRESAQPADNEEEIATIKTENEALKRQIEELQKLNRGANVETPPPDLGKQLSEIVKDFM